VKDDREEQQREGKEGGKENSRQHRREAVHRCVRRADSQYSTLLHLSHTAASPRSVSATFSSSSLSMTALSPPTATSVSLCSLSPILDSSLPPHLSPTPAVLPDLSSAVEGSEVNAREGASDDPDGRLAVGVLEVLVVERGSGLRHREERSEWLR
jgi:hypothetical protein